MPLAVEPGRTPGRVGLDRPLRPAEPSRAGLPRPGTGAGRAVAAAGTPGAPAGTTPWTGEPGAATRAVDRGLSRRGRAAGRIPAAPERPRGPPAPARDRKSTRLNSSHANISYAVFCLKKKKKKATHIKHSKTKKTT